MKVLAIIAFLFAVSESQVTHPIPYSVYVSLGGLPYPEALRAKERHTYTLEELYDNNTRIVGGEEASENEYGFLASLQRSSHSCGCSIMTQYSALTAAHCVAGVSANNLYLRIGSNYHASGGTRLSVSRVVSHSSYNSGTIDYDIAFVIVGSPMAESDTVKHIKTCSTHPPDGSHVTVAGWGSLQSGGSCCPARYRKVVVPVVPTSTCNAPSSYNGAVTPRMFCAGAMEGGKDSCQGDSGGPVITPEGCLAGIVSWGRGCASPNYPGVYTNCNNLQSWITANIQN